MFYVAMLQCVDDNFTAERQATVLSAWVSWRCLLDLWGFVDSEEKSPLPSQDFRVIGIQTLLSSFPNRIPKIAMAKSRKEALIEEIMEIIDNGVLLPGHASKLYGKLSFGATQALGRSARAKLRAIHRRAHE